MKTSIHHRSLANLDAVGDSCEGDRAQKSWQVFRGSLLQAQEWPILIQENK